MFIFEKQSPILSNPEYVTLSRYFDKINPQWEESTKSEIIRNYFVIN
jgi:hypothetical protein